MATKRKKRGKRRPVHTPTPLQRTQAVEEAVHTGVLVGPAEHPRALAAADKALLAEALRRAEEVRATVATAFVGFGRWLLVALFRDDARAALERRREFPVWSELVARAGGPTLRMSRHALYMALSIAAYDKHITDENWRLLETGRKQLLLPLGDEAQMRKAAQHVVAMKLSLRATRDYVRAQIRARGRVPLVRMSATRARAMLDRMAEPLADKRVRTRLREKLEALTGRERAAARKQLEVLREAVAELLGGFE